MRKVLWGVCLFFLLTVSVNAVTINKVQVSGDTEKKIGEEGSFYISVSFNGISKGWNKPLGVWAVGLAFESDDAIKITGISAPGFDSLISFDSEYGFYYIASEVSEDGNSNDLCGFGNLYCSDYVVKVNYVIKDTTKEVAVVDVIQTNAYLLEITEADIAEEKEYELEDAIPLESQETAKYKVSIKKQNSNINSNSNTVVKPSVTPSKSENKMLKSLTVEGYELDFDKQKTDYTITVDEGVNSLTVKATPEDKNATYKVIGADDLTASKNIVRVEVTAQDKTKQIYYIRVRYNKNNEDKIKEQLKNEIGDGKTTSTGKTKKEEVNPNILKWAGIIFGVILAISIIGFIISKIRDRSIDKKLAALDDD